MPSPGQQRTGFTGNPALRPPQGGGEAEQGKEGGPGDAGDAGRARRRDEQPREERQCRDAGRAQGTGAAAAPGVGRQPRGEGMRQERVPTPG